MFSGITADSISDGVQEMFPRFTFDETSKPSRTQLERYATSAINRVLRMVSWKGYDSSDIVEPEDLQFVQDIIELTVAVEVHVTLDQMKDTKTANPRFEQLQSLLREWKETENPFPAIKRRADSVVQTLYPDLLVRE
jgi:hypothetical protein